MYQLMTKIRIYKFYIRDLFYNRYASFKRNNLDKKIDKDILEILNEIYSDEKIKNISMVAKHKTVRERARAIFHKHYINIAKEIITVLSLSYDEEYKGELIVKLLDKNTTLLKGEIVLLRSGVYC